MDIGNSVLIIGSTGLVGQAFVHHLAHYGSFSKIYSASRSGKLVSPAQNIRLDIRSGDDLAAFFRHHKPALVINASGITGFSACENNPELAMDVNVGGVKKLITYLDYDGVSLIQLSTNAVFGCGPGNYNEEDIPDPESVYGQTRWEAEKVVTESGLDHMIIRTCDVYGFYAYEDRSPRLFHQVIRTLRSGLHFNAFDDVWSSPTSILDLCRAAMFLITEGHSGIFHMAGPDRVSRHEYVNAIAEVFELDTALIRSEKSNGSYCANNTLNIDKLENHHFQSKSLVEGLKEIRSNQVGNDK